jgi:hypothetical protein
MSYFIGLVVVLRIVLRNPRLLFVFEILNEVVKIDLLSPLLAANKPIYALASASAG